MYCKPYVGKFSCTQKFIIIENGYIFSHDVVICYVFYYFYYMLIVCTHLLTHNKITNPVYNQEIVKLEYTGYSTSFRSMTERCLKDQSAETTTQHHHHRLNQKWTQLHFKQQLQQRWLIFTMGTTVEVTGKGMEVQTRG